MSRSKRRARHQRGTTFRRALNCPISSNKWTNEKRKVAWSLKHEFGLDKHKALTVFKRMFDSDPTTSMNELSASALAAQWNECRLARYSGWIETNNELDTRTESGRAAAKQVADQVRDFLDTVRSRPQQHDTSLRHSLQTLAARSRPQATTTQMSFTSSPSQTKEEAKAKAAERKRQSQRHADLLQSLEAMELDREYPEAEVHIDENTSIRYRSSRKQSLPTPRAPQPQPSRISKKAIRDTTKIPYLRTYGGTCMVSPQQLEMSAGRQAIAAEVAHVDSSKADLFFRYWHPASQGKNSYDGFVAGHFRRSNVEVDPPGCDDPMMLSWAENHLNQHDVDSPFVSLSNDFFWVVRKACKLAVDKQLDPNNMHISVINAKALNPKGVYWAKPYHDELKRKMYFVGGAHRYGATHEFFVWNKVPQEAVMSTFTIAGLYHEANRIPSLNRLLRLDLISEKGDLKGKIQPRLKAMRMTLAASTGAIAQLCSFIGLGCQSNYRHIEQLVRDVVCGWQICVTELTSNEWSQLANHFWHVLARATYVDTQDECEFVGSEPLQPSRQFKMMGYFLFGVRSGMIGLDNFFLQDTEKKLRRMNRQAEQVNLFPEQIMDTMLRQCSDVSLNSFDNEARRYGSSQVVHTFSLTQDQVQKSPAATANARRVQASARIKASARPNEKGIEDEDKMIIEITDDSEDDEDDDDENQVPPTPPSPHTSMQLLRQSKERQGWKKGKATVMVQPGSRRAGASA